jgi:DNA repair protein RadC
VAESAVILETARNLAAAQMQRGQAFSNPRSICAYLCDVFRGMEAEQFRVVLLDNRHRMIVDVPMFNGTIDGASVHPREVVKAVLRHNAAAIILAHNHPSGVAEPSQADELITTRIRDAVALIDVRVLDHIIVAGDVTVSFAERGLL